MRLLILSSVIAVTICLVGRGGIDGESLYADTVTLHGGGRIVGQIINSPEGQTDETVTIQTEDQAIISIPKSEVKEIISLSEVQAEYQRLRQQTPDTVEGHWKLAEWCRDHNLSKEREVHLRRIIELDPEHQRARALLGYQKVGDQWKTRDEIMKSMGMSFIRGGGCSPSRSNWSRNGSSKQRSSATGLCGFIA